MKKLFFAAAAATLLAGPALAQSYVPSAGSGNIVRPNPVESRSGRVGATGVFAYIPTRQPGSAALARQNAPRWRHHR